LGGANGLQETIPDANELAESIMSQCPRYSICTFSSSIAETEPEAFSLLRTRYCNGNYSACARFAVMKALGPERVPMNLQPHHHDQARALIASR